MSIAVPTRVRILLYRVEDLLRGEPARFIGYGAAVVLVGIIAVANQLGVTRFGTGMSLADALTLSTTAITTLIGVIESIRHFVYAPDTVHSERIDAYFEGAEMEHAVHADDEGPLNVHAGNADVVDPADLPDLSLDG